MRQECGNPLQNVYVQIARKDSEYGSIPVVAVVWDDYETGCPEAYIQKCIEAFERFELPDEIHHKGRERMRLLRELCSDMEKWFDPK